MKNRDGINGMVVSDYHDKSVDFSATDFCKPDYQLWVSKNLERNESKQGFKAWVGQLVHKASYDFPENNVIKELSFTTSYDIDTTVGGSIDRLVWKDGLWEIQDIKTQGNFPASKSFKEPDEKWILQLSIYRYGLIKEYNLPVSLNATIHQYVMGFQANKIGMNEYNEISIRLLETYQVEEIMKHKIDIAKNKQAPLVVDCKTYLCKDYCDWNTSCPSYNKK